MSGAVLVAGSINMDLIAGVAQLPAAGETVPGWDLQYLPGGKGANQAVAAACAGADVRMIGCLGSDGFAEQLNEFLAEQGVDVNAIRRTEGASGVALIAVSRSGENQIVVIPGANAAVGESDVSGIDLSGIAVGMSQFEIPVPAVEAFFVHCRSQGVQTLLNTAPAISEVGDTLQLADVLLFNETELAKYAGMDLAESTDPTKIIFAADKIRATPEQAIVVTLGERGLVAVWGDEQVVLGSHKVDVVDTTGAGDCFAGYLAAGIASDLSWAEALHQASVAASLSVTRPGAGPSMPSIEEVVKEVGA